MLDQHVEVAERFDGQRNHLTRLSPIGDIVMAGNGPTPGGFDLGDHLLSGGRVGAPSEKVAPEIVHHDPGALSGEKQRMRSPQTAPGAP